MGILQQKVQQKSLDRILDFTAILLYRVAHELYQQEVPYYPRALSEYAHSKQGLIFIPAHTLGIIFS